MIVDCLILSDIIPCFAWGVTPYFFLRVTTYFFPRVTPYFFATGDPILFSLGDPILFFGGEPPGDRAWAFSNFRFGGNASPYLSGGIS